MGLNEKNSKVVNHFFTLRDEINSLLDNKLVNKSHLQNYLFFTVAPLFNYTEAIIILSKSGKSNAAQMLLRSLFETHINIHYYSNGDIEKKLAVAAKRQFDWRRTVVNSFIELITKYRNLESYKEKSVFNRGYLENKLIEINNNREIIVRSNGIKIDDKDPDLLDKAKLCDGMKLRGVESGHFESMYHLVYRQLSSFVHLDMQGIESFNNKNEKGEYFFEEKNDEDLLISQSVGICIALIKDLYETKVIRGNLHEAVKSIEDLINNIDIS